jgi:K+-sensing histidine kinase KdpD
LIRLASPLEPSTTHEAPEGQREKASLALEMAAGATMAATATAIGWWILGRRLEDVVMLFLLGIVSLAMRFGYAASLTAMFCSVLSVDFFFTAPYLSFTVDDHRQYLTFAIMAVVALLISGQTRRVRREAATRVSLALERARLAEEAHAANLEAREERLRNALLSSVSHDLKTPLSVILGSASALLDDPARLAESRRREALELIVSEAKRLTRLIRNLVDMTSVQSGTLRARKDWHSLEDVVGAALARLDDSLGGRHVSIGLDPDASVAAFDGALIEEVLVNLIENAIKYTPAGSPIAITAHRDTEGVVVEVADSGPGIPDGQEEAIFDKFHRATAVGVGMGLGLTICRGILTVHEGRIWAGNRPEGGAFFRFVLPGPAPALPEECPLPMSESSR